MTAIRIERHELGPRLHLLGRRWHHYHTGLALMAWGVRWIYVDREDAWDLLKKLKPTRPI